MTNKIKSRGRRPSELRQALKSLGGHIRARTRMVVRKIGCPKDHGRLVGRACYFLIGKKQG